VGGEGKRKEKKNKKGVLFFSSPGGFFRFLGGVPPVSDNPVGLSSTFSLDNILRLSPWIYGEKSASFGILVLAYYQTFFDHNH